MSALGAHAGEATKGLPAAQSPAVRLLVATGLACAVWTAAQAGVGRVLPVDHAAYLLATLAVLVSASVAGMGAGLLTTALLAPAAFVVWDDPDLIPAGEERWQDAAQMALFVLVGGAISVLAGREAAAKRAARENEERFRRILEQGPLGIAIVGRDDRVQAANDMFCRMLGLGPDEILGRAVGSLTYPPDAAESAAMLHRLWDGDLPTGYTLVKRYVRTDGTTFWATLSVAVIRDERGQPAYAVGMVQDISDRKRMEEDLQRSRAQAEAARELAEVARAQAEGARERAEAASRAKDQFLAVLSHELRTPLSPVLLTASSLEANPSLPASLRDDVHTIRQSAEIEARLIDDLLDVTGIARGKLSLHRERVDAHALVGQALYMVERDAVDKGLRVRADLGAPCADVDADPTRLQQVFWNLAKNAVKFTPEGGEVVVRTRCEAIDVAGAAAREWLVVELRDSGAGIAPDVLPRLFRPFEQGSDGVTRQFGGLGLGLAIARSIVELHGGRIEAESAGVGRGATFRVRLPVASATSGLLAAEPLPPPPPADHAGQRLRVLLVEDHAPTRRAMRAILSSLGHEVMAAGTLAEALAAAEAGDVDLVVSDLALPDGSGHDLMRRLKERRPSLRGVAVSGFGMADDVRRSRDAGFDEHLTKPLTRDRIREVLSRLGTASPRPTTPAG